MKRAAEDAHVAVFLGVPDGQPTHIRAVVGASPTTPRHATRRSKNEAARRPTTNNKPHDAAARRDLTTKRK